MSDQNIPSNVLITGGCGFLGSNIASDFLSAGSHVVVIDALFRTGCTSNLQWLRDQAKPEKFQFIGGDIADPEVVNSVFKTNGPFNYICHLGGQVAMTTSLTDPRRDFLTNACGTFNVLESTRQFSPDALVAYSSTNKVYGDLLDLRYDETPTRYYLPDYPFGLGESLPLDFASPYGCSKGAADQYVRDWFRNFGIKTVVFRHSSIYGGRQFSTFDQGWIGWFCRQALDQQTALKAGEIIEPFTIAGTGKQVRDALHAEDLISLYRAAYKNKETISGEIFNIGGGSENSLSLLELFTLMQQTLGLEIQLNFKHTPRRQSDQDYFVADIRKAQRLLGWQPKISAKQGISLMLDWVRGSLPQL